MDSINGTLVGKNVLDFPSSEDELTSVDDILQTLADVNNPYTDDNRSSDEPVDEKEDIIVDSLLMMPQGAIYQQMMNDNVTDRKGANDIDISVHGTNAAAQAAGGQNILNSHGVKDVILNAIHSFMRSENIDVDDSLIEQTLGNVLRQYAGSEGLLEGKANAPVSTQTVVLVRADDETHNQELPRQSVGERGTHNQELPRQLVGNMASHDLELPRYSAVNERVLNKSTSISASDQTVTTDRTESTQNVQTPLRESIGSQPVSRDQMDISVSTEQPLTFNKIVEHITTDFLHQYAAGGKNNNEHLVDVATFLKKNSSAENHRQSYDVIEKNNQQTDVIALQHNNVTGMTIPNTSSSIPAHAQTSGESQTTSHTQLAAQIEKALQNMRNGDISQPRSATTEINWAFSGQQAANVRIEHGQNRFETTVRMTPSDSEVGEKLANFQRQNPLQALRVDIAPSANHDNQQGQRHSQQQHANQDAFYENEEEA